MRNARIGSTLKLEEDDHLRCHTNGRCWCSSGPDDRRKGGIIRPSRVCHAKSKTAAGRPNTKRGCVCHFIVKHLIAEPTVALIIYNQGSVQCPVLLSYWRVRHSWHKNLVGKCPDTEQCVEMSRRLGQAMDDFCQRNGDFDLFQKFAEDFLDCVEFLDHFVAVCLPKLGMWISKLKMLPIASQETCAAMEFYHHELKLRLLNEKDQSAYQRLDWLVHKLGTKDIDFVPDHVPLNESMSIVEEHNMRRNIICGILQRRV